MTARQKQILHYLKQQHKKAHKRERVLEKLNRDHANQHYWYDWMRAEGYAAGLAMGLVLLQSFIKAAKWD